MGGGADDEHADRVLEPSERRPLVGDAILGADDDQRWRRGGGEVADGPIGVLRLHREKCHVAIPPSDLAGAPGSRHAHAGVCLRRAEGQAPLPDGGEVRAARNDGHLQPGPIEEDRHHPTDRAGAEDDVTAGHAAEDTNRSGPRFRAPAAESVNRRSHPTLPRLET
jgi:hypothetical protein